MQRNAQAAEHWYLEEEFVMSKILRVRFVRGEKVKYVSHLDLMKTFERSIRRAGLPLAYSQGFNPHPGMVFGLPLSVGVTSEGEYADIELTEDIAEQTFIQGVNSSFPEGLNALEGKYLEVKGNIMRYLAGASYDILVTPKEDYHYKDVVEDFSTLLSQDKIMVEKESKGKTKEVDIKPLIYGVSVSELGINNGMNNAGITTSDTTTYIEFKSSRPFLAGDGAFCKKYLLDVVEAKWKTSYDVNRVVRVSLFCSAGSEDNLKPGLFIKALESMTQKPLNIIKVHRTELFIEKDGGLIKPI